MNVSTKWLIDLVPGLAGGPEEISEHLALRGAPVDDITSPGRDLSDIIIGRVIRARQHPNADRLKVCDVDVGEEEIKKVVCGANNVRENLKVVFAPIGSTIPSNGLILKKKDIRGYTGEGMLCSYEELCLEGKSDGIIELDNNYDVGSNVCCSMYVLCL